MFLFLSIIVICFLLTVARDIVKLFRISSRISRHYNVTTNPLQDVLNKAKAERDAILNETEQDRYVRQIKLMRAEDKMMEAEKKIKKVQRKKELESYYVELVAGYAFKTILYLILAFITIRNRYNPVMTFGEDINLQPLQGLLSFPTGVPNAISVPIWGLSCNVSFKLITDLVKQQLSKPKIK
ncbi:guided entry of tail-anchored proteins factor 1 [Stomoxys calcitrans]|uniref:Uncharacterized protein n=1 Tax=Stomoxys calcitrans TaxID=35570 RepID=A0A1I8Q5X4_STOCA|nr:guided entry of tail-anchored proteins factor 1 [Stomoxys calcitrans]